MILITGASDNHFKSLCIFINSVLKFGNLNKNMFIIYDLGLADININILKVFQEKFANIIFKKFNYIHYPSWYDITINAGEYAWKPAIIYEIYKEYPDEILLWMDAGNILKYDINYLENIIINNYLYSPVSSGNINKWTHQTTIEHLNPVNLYEENRNGACFGFNTKIQWIKYFIEEFYKLSCDKKCIAPDGSDRSNHRQDQAIFTILYYKYKYKYNFNNIDQYIYFTIHNDID